MRRAILSLGILLALVTGAFAQTWGIFQDIAPPPVQMDGVKRAIFNVNIQGGSTRFMFINLFQNGNGWPSPSTAAGSGYMNGTNFWNSSMLNSFGFPVSTLLTSAFGGGFYPFTQAQNPGPYCLDGLNTGAGAGSSLNIGSGWSGASSGVLCAVLGSNGKPTGATTTCNSPGGVGTHASLSGSTVTVTTGGTNGYWCIGLTATSLGIAVGGPQPVTVTSSDGGLGPVAVYLVTDTADRAAGKIYRNAFKQLIVNFNPGAIRFMQWNNTGLSQERRWENRHIPDQGTAGGGNGGAAPGPGVDSCSFLPYTALSYSSATGADVYSIGSVSSSGCTNFSGSTPVATQHGESLIAFVPTAPTQFGVGGATGCGTQGPQCACQITALAAGATTTVTTAQACVTAGQVGKKAILYLADNADPPSTTGAMTNLHLFPVTISSFTNSTNFVVSFNSTGGTWNNTNCGSQKASCYVAPYICLNVNSRGIGADSCYPMVRMFDGFMTTNFDTAWTPVANGYTLFQFDANSSALTDGSGNYLKGVWTVRNSNTSQPSAPIEYQVALVNEVNAMYTTQAPTHLWMTIPGRVIIPQDPNWTSASDWPQNMYNLVMNGDVAHGWAPLCAKCGVLFELSNETWNFGAIPTSDTSYFMRQGFLRWPGPPTDTGDPHSYFTLRSMLVMSDIKNASAYAGNASRTRFVMAGQGSQANLPGNTTRLFGSNGTINFVNSDAQNPLTHNTSFTGTVSGTTLTITSAVTGGPVGIGDTLNYAASGSGACIITAGSGTSWTVTNVPTSKSSTVLTNCAAATTVAITSTPGPMTLFHKFSGDSYADFLGGTGFSATNPFVNDSSTMNSLSSYTSATGVLNVVFTSSWPASLATGVDIGINGATGTGGFASLNGLWSAAVTSIPTTTISSGTYNSGTGLITLTLGTSLPNGTYSANMLGLTGSGADIGLAQVRKQVVVSGGTTLTYCPGANADVTGSCTLTGKTITISGGTLQASANLTLLSGFGATTITGGNINVISFMYGAGAQGGQDYTAMVGAGGSCVLAVCSGSGSTAVNNDITYFINQMYGNGTNCNSTSTTSCRALIFDSNAVVLGLFPQNREMTAYEGGTDSWTDNCPTADCVNFMAAVISGTTWGNSYLQLLTHMSVTANEAYPSATLNMVCNGLAQGVPDWKWSGGFCTDIFNTTNTEGTTVPFWTIMSTFNNGKYP